MKGKKMRMEKPRAAQTTALMLDIGSDGSMAQGLTDAQTWLRRQVPLGLDTLVRQSLRHAPPRPLELEHAIELTEEAVMPLAAEFAPAAELILQGEGAALVAGRLRAAGIAQAAFTVDEVEALFNRLVAVSEGRPLSQETLASDAGFFAAMLMLRESMHHLHFARVTLQTGLE